jgi:hypothetical protein
MPVIFIHGVNTRRDDPAYRTDVAARDELLRRLVLTPLAAKGERYRITEINNAYWGDSGVRFHWNQASLPRVRALEDLGPAGETPRSDVELLATVDELAGGPGAAGHLESLGAAEGVLKRAALNDPVRFVEATLAPVFLAEERLDEQGDLSPGDAGRCEALLAEAAYAVATDPGVRAAMGAATSDEEVIDLLKEAIEGRFVQLLRTDGPAADRTRPGRLEVLGPAWWQTFKDRAGELIVRAANVPGRLTSTALLRWRREGLQRNVSRFLGDVFVYLTERGDALGPGPIIRTVKEAIHSAGRNHADEPTIIITHSMGGNILYDLLTYYDTGIKVDAWVSVAAQVGQLEEMKLFRASCKDLGAPSKVPTLAPRLGFWLNVYDPADVLSFLAEPVFADAHDVAFSTGASSLGSHGAYFKRASFYHLVRQRLEGALP